MKSKLFLGIVGIFAVCCIAKERYDPDRYLSAQQKDSVLNLIIRYIAKPPKGVSGDARFDRTYDQYYQKKISESNLEQFFTDGPRFYFLVSQPAPSLIEKRHATGGWFTPGDGALQHYMEVFRTWKMVPDVLKKRSYMLFHKMVVGEDLQPYHTGNSDRTEFIEFPDDKVYFNADTRSWEIRK
jgi:hypothetical protein